MQVVVNGLMTSYQKSGQGKSIILLHGWGDNCATFEKLVELLDDDYELFAVDLPGIGQTQAPEEAWGLDDYAEFVGAWLEKIGINNPCAIIGHSNGGAIAMHGIAKDQLKAKKLILLASAGIRNNHKIRKSLLKAVSKTGKAITLPLPNRTRMKIRNRLYKRIGSEIGLFPQMEETFRKIISEDTQADAKNIKIPTLLMYGTQDRVTPVSYGRIFNSLIPGSKLEEIDAGHFLHQEQPEQVAKLIKDFLA